uniref:Uncharacterized protein n=1 Tax=Ditylenchus dipsaci TaxID=166011 RepID=A0A915CMH9_9BILA
MQICNVRLGKRRDCRTELDLRIGAAFVFKPCTSKKHFANILDGVISYGSSNSLSGSPRAEKLLLIKSRPNLVSPTLDCGRTLTRPSKALSLSSSGSVVGKDLKNKFDFTRERVRLFDMDATRAIHELCKEASKSKSYS